MKKLLVLAGPAASGKDSVRQYLLDHYNFIGMISTTNRPPREVEEERKNYYFKSKEDFDEMSKNKCFGNEVEFAGRKYALEYKEIEKCETNLVCSILESTGIQQLKEQGINIFTILLMPESVQLMQERINLREVDQAEVECRTALSQHELFSLFPLANTIIVNYRNSKIEDLAKQVNDLYLEWYNGN